MRNKHRKLKIFPDLFALAVASSRRQDEISVRVRITTSRRTRATFPAAAPPKHTPFCQSAAVHRSWKCTTLENNFQPLNINGSLPPARAKRPIDLLHTGWTSNHLILRSQSTRFKRIRQTRGVPSLSGLRAARHFQKKVFRRFVLIRECSVSSKSSPFTERMAKFSEPPSARLMD